MKSNKSFCVRKILFYTWNDKIQMKYLLFFSGFYGISGFLLGSVISVYIVPSLQAHLTGQICLLLEVLTYLKKNYVTVGLRDFS